MSLEWMLPLVGHEPSSPCEDAQLTTCLSGFAIQVGGGPKVYIKSLMIQEGWRRRGPSKAEFGAWAWAGFGTVWPVPSKRTLYCFTPLQGNMDSRRRNYTLVWEQLDARLKASATLRGDERFMINVVGSGSPSKLEVGTRAVLPHPTFSLPWVPNGQHHHSFLPPFPPQVPPQLDARVRPHVNLRFDAFYDLIYHNFALIPTLASEAYYDRKFSSTVITR